MNTLSIRIADTSKDAPNYRGGDFKPARLKEAFIVAKGTESGKPTVDLVFEITDPAGNVTDIAVAMTTGAIIKALASAIEGTEAR